MDWLYISELNYKCVIPCSLWENQFDGKLVDNLVVIHVINQAHFQSILVTCEASNLRYILKS